MSYYRKKPVIIDAIQWDGTAAGASQVIAWILDGNGTARYVDSTPRPECPGLHENGPFTYCDQKGCGWKAGEAVLHIDTLEGVMTASSGDWIIQGVRGEFYPCKPDIFEATYEPVEEIR